MSAVTPENEEPRFYINLDMGPEGSVIKQITTLDYIRSLLEQKYFS